MERAPEVVTLPAPAAGTNPVWQSPANLGFRLLAVCAKLVADATVAARKAQLQLKDGDGNLLGAGEQSATLAASVTSQVTWWVGITTNTSVAAQQSVALPDMPLPAGSSVTITTVTLKAGDKWETVVLLIAYRDDDNAASS